MFSSLMNIIRVPEGAKRLLADIRAMVLYASASLFRQKAALVKWIFVKLLAFPLGLSLIYITKATLDDGILSKDLKVFLFLSIAGVIIFVVDQVLKFVSEKILSACRATFAKDINTDLTLRLFGMDYMSLRRLSSSENSFIMDYDQNVIESVVFDELPALAGLVKIPVYLVLAAALSPILTVLALAALPFIAAHMLWASGKRRGHRIKVYSANQRHYSVLHDLLLNIKMIKSLFVEGWAADRVITNFARKTGYNYRLQVFTRTARLAGTLMSRIGAFVFCIIGGYLVIIGDMTFGTFSAVSMYMALVISEVQNLSGIFQDIFEERTAIRRTAMFINELKDYDRKALDRGEAARLDGQITVRDLHFAYPGGMPVLKGVNMDIPLGGWTLLQGVSGCGKTTLICALLRLLRCGEGGITLGGRELASIPEVEMPHIMSVAHQDTFLLNDTIRNNVLLGRKADEAAWEKAVYCSGLDELAGLMPMGYNTRVGENGTRLSGGQRQRIAIARALLGSPDLLILDEATASLDIPSEEKIFSAIRDTYEGITVLFVTHRDASVKYADNVYKMDQMAVKPVLFGRGEEE